MKDKPINVLLIEDDTKYAQVVRMMLSSKGGNTRFNLECTGSLSEGLKRLTQGGIELVLLDLQLPDSGGLETFIEINKQAPSMPIIVLTGDSDETTAVKAVNMGAQDYLIKGDTKSDYLVQSIRYAIERKRAEESLRKAHDELERRVEERTAELMKTNESLKREIAERRQAEEALATEKERLAVTLRSIGDGVIATDTNGKIVLMNKAAEQITEWHRQEAIGKPLEEIFFIVNKQTGKRCENPVESSIRTDQTVGLKKDTVLITRKGAERFVSATSSPIHDKDNNIIGVVLVFRDITERKKMEEEVLKAQKLESIGVLAGGIAHDFNNLLTVILGNISLTKMYLDPGEKSYERITEAEKACFRARDLTMQLLTFSKGGIPVKRLASLASLIKESAEFILRGSNVRCEFSIADDLWSVEVDEAQITQVINNLITNAEHAMPEGGVIKIKAENVTRYEPSQLWFSSESQAESPTKAAFPDHEGRWIKITVEDEGIGIPGENLPKIFDPYFTTKKKGGGLGLATVYSIIKNHNGHIDVTSEVGVGTRFSIYLPASDKRATTSTTSDERVIEGKGRILVMDDEDMIRDAIGEMLNRIGYEVEYARDGREAIEKYNRARKSERPFDIVIMDLTIPGGMGGKETIEELRGIDPEIRAVVSSGYSNDPVMSDYRRYGFKGVVVKPYRIEELSRVLHRVMVEG
jgi:PAS domain S-box-containing protein